MTTTQPNRRLKPAKKGNTMTDTTNPPCNVVRDLVRHAKEGDLAAFYETMRDSGEGHHVEDLEQYVFELAYLAADYEGEAATLREALMDVAIEADNRRMTIRHTIADHYENIRGRRLTDALRRESNPYAIAVTPEDVARRQADHDANCDCKAVQS